MNSDYSKPPFTDREERVLSTLPDERPDEDTAPIRQEEGYKPPPPLLSPEIPDADLSVDFSMILGQSSVQTEKLEKRKTNLLKMQEENEKLRRELQAMSERLAAAERKRAELQAQREAGSGRMESNT